MQDPDTATLSPPKQTTKPSSRNQSPAPTSFNHASTQPTKLTEHQQPEETMGLTQTKPEAQNNKSKPTQPSDFVRLATEASNMQQPKSRSSTPVCAIKSPLERLEEISARLDELDKDVNSYKNGTNKKDKRFLQLEEYLTRCLLNLDEIERGDERINDQRKKLINFTQKIIEKLDAKLSPPDEILSDPQEDKPNQLQIVEQPSDNPQQDRDQNNEGLKQKDEEPKPN